MIEAIHEKSQACAACSLEKSSILEIKKLDFLKKITGLLTSCLMCCVCKDIPWIPFLAIFS